MQWLFRCHRWSDGRKPSGIEELAPSPCCKIQAEVGRGTWAAEVGVPAAAYSLTAEVLVVRGGEGRRGNAAVAADRSIGDTR